VLVEVEVEVEVEVDVEVDVEVEMVLVEVVPAGEVVLELDCTVDDLVEELVE